MKSRKILLVGGGTAGHIDPALAIGDWLSKNSSQLDIDFLGTKSGMEQRLVPAAGFKLKTLNKIQFPRKLNLKALFFPFNFFIALVRALWIIRKYQVVVGFGGYVSAPAYIAGKLLGKKLIIHEANAKPGWANKLGKALTELVYVGLPIKDHDWKSYPVIGIPLKEEFINFFSLDAANRKSKAEEYLKSLGLDSNKKTILIVGGSLGSQKINKLAEELIDFCQENSYQIIHSFGKNGDCNSDLSKGYYATDYINQIYLAINCADLIISRSGAVTCAQIAVANKPAILLPLSIGNGEQAENAKYLSDIGVGDLILDEELNLKDLKGKIREKIVSKSSESTVNVDAKALNHLEAVAKLGKVIMNQVLDSN